MKLPFLLAGPQIRIASPTRGVTIWVAFSRPCKVSIWLYEGKVVIPTAVTPLIKTPPQQVISLGNLHFIAAQCKLPLVTGLQYSYDLMIEEVPNGSRHNLQSLEVLTDNPASNPARLAIGYEPNALPAFVVPDQASLTSIVHGSCRKCGGPGEDALARLDDILRENRRISKPLKPLPYLLVLSGDQIYADDVPLAVLPNLTAIGQTLVGKEYLPVRGLNETKLEVIDQARFPSGARNLLTKMCFSSTKAAGHLLSFGEFAAMYLLAWSSAMWEFVSIPLDLDAFERAHSANRDMSLLGSLDSPAQGFPKISRSDYEAEVGNVRRFLSGVPRVERALANIPTFMIFDDHEITDDWNRTFAWQGVAFEKLKAELKVINQWQAGRAIVRNGLAAYACFQDIGNDPGAYADGQSDKRLSITEYSRLLGSPLQPTVWATAADSLDKLWGIGVNVRPKVRWDYRWSDPLLNFDIVVLDTRTRRDYPSEISPPMLIAPGEIEEQFRDVPAKPDRYLIVVSPGNVISDGGLKQVQRKSSPLMSDNANDRESWDENGIALALLLRKLADYSKVVILSGDVHHGFCTLIEYYEPSRRATIIQFVSSAIKNEAEGFGSDIISTEGTAYTRLYENYGEQYGMAFAEPLGAIERYYRRQYVENERVEWVKAAGLSEPDLHDVETVKRRLLTQPKAYWKSTQLPLVQRVGTISLPSSRKRTGKTGVMLWKNHLCIVTFKMQAFEQTPVGVVTDVLLNKTHSWLGELNRGNEPFGYGWAP